MGPEAPELVVIDEIAQLLGDGGAAPLVNCGRLQRFRGGSWFFNSMGSPCACGVTGICASAASERGSSWIPPHVVAIACKAAELDIIAVLAAAMLEDKGELVLAAIERAHPGTVLDPDAEVLDFGVDAVGGGEQLCGVASIHADVMRCARRAECRKVAENARAARGGRTE